MSYSNLRRRNGHDPAWKKGPPDPPDHCTDDLIETFDSCGFESYAGELARVLLMIENGMELVAPQVRLTTRDWWMCEDDGYMLCEAEWCARIEEMAKIAESRGLKAIAWAARNEAKAIHDKIVARCEKMRQIATAYAEWHISCRCEVAFVWKQGRGSEPDQEVRMFAEMDFNEGPHVGCMIAEKGLKYLAEADHQTAEVA